MLRAMNEKRAAGGLIGIDEVGRGCWAGPLLVVAARQIATLPPGVADSKALNPKRRQSLFAAIGRVCEFGEGWGEAAEIDELGLAAAMRLGVSRALDGLKAATNARIILDGIVNYCPADFAQVDCVAKADAHYPIVSAASIWAKVRRDDYMKRLSQAYPGYGFERHVGYGTALHRQNLLAHGVCALHRLSFRPVKELAAGV